MVATLKKIPYIKPKKNTIRNSKGSASWKKMVTLFQDNQDEFEKHYHKRSLVESVFAVLKGIFGNNLSSKNKLVQRKELAFRVICYNIRVVNLMEVTKHVRG
jgi:transposase